MNNKGFTCLSDEELKLFREQIDAALLTLRKAVRRYTEDVIKHEEYCMLLTMSIDVAIEISMRKEIQQ